jgi:hypothetical protein
MTTAQPEHAPGGGAGGGADTSVVDTCLKKIQAALGSDNVKVTGTNMRYE